MELVERELEMRVLQYLLVRVEAGRGHVVLVAGEAGIGKTSLLQTLAEQRKDVVLWWGACDALQTPHPLAPLHDIARSADVGFRALLAVEDSRAALFEAVLTELQCSRRPTLVVIEDVHWADEATLDCLKFLGRRIERAACLLVVSLRDDQLSAGHPLRRFLGNLPSGLVTRIDLAGLSSTAVDLLARRALRSPEGIHAASHGNPFFVTELLRHNGKEVPRAVQDLVLARYADLGADAQAIVRLASVVPARIERWLVERLLGLPVAPLEACLNSGLLATTAESALCFRHELARVAIESSLSEPVARDLHTAVLRELVAEPAAGASLARLVHHAVRAGDHAAVMRFAPEAAKQAKRRGAYREAAALCGTALRHVERAGLGHDAELISLWLDGYAGGCERADQLDLLVDGRLRLGELYRRSGNVSGQARNLSLLAMTYTLTLRNAQADAASLEAVAMLEPLPPGPDHARVFQVQAYMRSLDLDHEAAIRWSRRALAVAEQMGERENALLATVTLGSATMRVDYDAGRALVMHALQSAIADERYFAAVNALNNLIAGSCDQLELQDTRQFLAQALALCERDEFERCRSYYLAWSAMCDVHLGRWDEAAEHALEVVRLPSAWTTTRIAALIALGRVQSRRGDADAAATLDEALDLALASNTFRHMGPVRAARAEAAFLRGDMGALMEEAHDALPQAAERRHPWIAGELAYWLSRAGLGDGIPQPCAEPYLLQLEGHWSQAAAAWSRIGCPYEEARARAEGDGDAPLQAWRQFVAMGAQPAADALQRQLRKAGRRRELPRVARPATQANPFQLTTREVEVLSLLCGGLRNAAIAERLVRSVRTVDHHLAAIYAKLGVTSRSEAVAAALRAGIAAKE